MCRRRSSLCGLAPKVGPAYDRTGTHVRWVIGDKGRVPVRCPLLWHNRYRDASHGSGRTPLCAFFLHTSSPPHGETIRFSPPCFTKSCAPRRRRFPLTDFGASCNPRNALVTRLATYSGEQAAGVSNRSPQSPAKGRKPIADKVREAMVETMNALVNAKPPTVPIAVEGDIIKVWTKE